MLRKGLTMSRLALCDVVGPLCDLLQKLSGDQGDLWLKALNKMLRKENAWDHPSISTAAEEGQTFHFVIDYSRSVRDSIKAGCYDDAHVPEIEKLEQDKRKESVRWEVEDWFHRYSREVGKRSVVARLYHFNKDISQEEAINIMDKDGYLPASIRETLAFGENNPELQKTFMIISPSRFILFHGCLSVNKVTALWGTSSTRSFGIIEEQEEWGADCRLLAVRK
jgi:hypothetical protein